MLSRNSLLLFTALNLGAFSSALFAADIQCDSKQTFCMIKDRRLVIGDEVAIMNTEKEVVAFAEVAGMKGEKRRVNVTKKLGDIHEGASVRYINPEHSASLEKHYTLYKAPSRIKAGAGIGLSSMNLAEDTQAFSVDGYAQYRWRYGVQLVGRVNFFTASGTAIDVENDDQEETFSIQGLSVMPGIAYELLPKQAFSFRNELAVGATYISASVSGNSFPRSLDKLNEGVGGVARFGSSVVYNRLGEWHPDVTVAFLKIMDARSTTLSVGVTRKVK
jgi:hypothetical protein